MALIAEISHGDIGSAFMLVLNAIDQVVLSLLSAFSGYSPIDLLVDGRVVSMDMVFSAAGWLVLGWTLVCGLIGVAIFRRRELARVTVWPPAIWESLIMTHNRLVQLLAIACMILSLLGCAELIVPHIDAAPWLRSPA